MATYTCYLDDAFGNRLAIVDDFVSLKYSRVVNDVGTLTLELPGDFDTSLIRIPDGRIEVWRNVDGREYLDTETTWLIQKISYKRDAVGTKTIVVEADSPLCLLKEPGHIAYGPAGGTVTTVIAFPADFWISYITNLHMGDSAPTAVGRSVFPYLTWAPSQQNGANVAKSFAYRELLKVCQELAQASTAQGVYVAFDIVAPTPSTLELRTYTQQRGNDHRWPGGQNPVLLSPDFGNVGESQLQIDYRDMASYVYCGGAGQGAARVIGTAADTTLQGLSPFAYREKFIELTNSADTTVLNNEAYAELRACRPRLSYTGKVLETEDTRYGVQWGWGDYVTVQDFGQSYDCRIEAVTVTVQPSQNYETVEAWLRSETYVVNK